MELTGVLNFSGPLGGASSGIALRRSIRAGGPARTKVLNSSVADDDPSTLNMAAAEISFHNYLDS